jgi:hypothetical protein
VFAAPNSHAIGVTAVEAARGEDKVLTFEFSATVLLSSAVKCFEELLQYAHNPLTLSALAHRRSNSDVFAPVIISISGTLLALADPSSPQVTPVMFKSSGAHVRTSALSSSSSSSSNSSSSSSSSCACVITAVARNVDALMLLQHLLKCRPVPPPRRTNVTVASLPADLRKKIAEQVLVLKNCFCTTAPVAHPLFPSQPSPHVAQARALPLPEGVFFDGRRYVSFDGGSCDDHPRLAELLNACVDSQNAEIDAFNADVGALERRLRAEAQVIRSRVPRRDLWSFASSKFLSFFSVARVRP